MNVLYYRKASGKLPVREYIDALPEADRAGITGDLELIAARGLINVPVETRHLGGLLWELKTGTGHQQRLFYFIRRGEDFILLHACKKQKKGAQPGDVKKARDRMNEVIKGDNR